MQLKETNPFLNNKRRTAIIVISKAIVISKYNNKINVKVIKIAIFYFYIQTGKHCNIIIIKKSMSKAVRKNQMK